MNVETWIDTRVIYNLYYLESFACSAVGDVNLAVASAATDQQTSFVWRVFDETDITDGPIVHRQLNLAIINKFVIDTQPKQNFVLSDLISSYIFTND